MPTTNRKVVMKQQPVGVPTPADFEIVSESLGTSTTVRCCSGRAG